MELCQLKNMAKQLLLFNEMQELLRYTILKIFQLQILACFVLLKILRYLDLVSSLGRKVGIKKS